MYKAVVIILSALILSPITISLGHRETDAKISFTESALSINRGYRYNVGGWIYVYIEGDPYERGFQHGYLLAHEIADMITRWSNIVHKMPIVGMFTGQPGTSLYNKTSELWWNFCKRRAMKVFWPDFPPEYKEEIRGIADGVKARGVKIFGRDVTYEDILNLNEMYETMQQLTNPQKGIHPLKTLFESLRRVVPKLNEKYEMEFVKEMLSQPPVDLCSGFIATGNATTNGQIVIAQSTFFGAVSWWFPYYIAQRWNVILDVNPSSGYRFQMSTAPGYIWSDENFYQNENGIVFIDTTYASQGPWFKSGLSLAVRTRKAIQYSNSIDDVIYTLRHNSNGVWPAVWLIGDTKTGEIARLDLGLYRYKVWRTRDGFYWSANNLMDEKVRAEQLRLAAIYQGRLFQLFHIIFKTEGYQYYTRKYYPCDRDLKFEELGKKYYGKIDVEVVKRIMSTPPIGDYASDCKVTDSYLVKENGLWAFWGNTEGKTWNATELRIDNYLEAPPNVEPAGWVRIFGLSEKDMIERLPRSMRLEEKMLSPRVAWSMVVDKDERNDVSPKIVNGDKYIYALTRNELLALDKDIGMIEWRKEFREAEDLDYLDGKVIVGYENGSLILDSEGKKLVDLIDNKRVSSVDMSKDLIAVGCYDGEIYIFDSAGNLIEELDAGDYPAYVEIYGDKIFVADGRDCDFIDKDGNVIWTLSLDGVVTEKPLIYDDKVFIPCWDGNLYSVDIKDGAIEWKFGCGWGIDTRPYLKDGIIYIGSMDNNLYAISAEDGSLIWNFSTNGAIRSSPFVYGDYVFFGSDDGRLYAVNKTTGICEWFFSARYSIDDNTMNFLTTPVTSSPIVTDNKLFIGFAGRVFALDPLTEEKIQTEIITAKVNYQASILFLVISALLIILLLGIYLYKTRS